MSDVTDKLRTLKTALENRLTSRLASDRHVIAWPVEHTTNVLSKFALGSDGQTADGRLHGRERRERICEFGERILRYVPKTMRPKIHQRWNMELSGKDRWLATNT